MDEPPKCLLTLLYGIVLQLRQFQLNSYLYSESIQKAINLRNINNLIINVS